MDNFVHLNANEIHIKEYITIAIRAQCEFDSSSIRQAATRNEADSNIHITNIKSTAANQRAVGGD